MSVFQAEILGILMATELVRLNVAMGSEVTLYVDSQAALKALDKHLINSKLVVACRRALRELLEHYVVRLCWVPGHCNTSGNEMAEELARQGSAKDVSESEINVKLPLGFFFRKINEWILARTNQAWGSRVDAQ